MNLRQSVGSVLSYLLDHQLAFGWHAFRSGINTQIRKRKRWQILLQSNIDNCTAFCIVHWNAPDFLLLTVNQIELLYPNCKIYIFDNSSAQFHLDSIKVELRKFNNVTLFALLSPPKWAMTLHLDTLFGWQSHTAGLQFLLNYSAKQSDEFAVFIDQDCIISQPIDEFFTKFSKDIILIGARQLYSPGNTISRLIHPSFMILQPVRIKKLFGDSGFYDRRTENAEAFCDPFQGLSLKVLERGGMFYLEPRRHSTIPLLTSYEYNDTEYAWHAWYSSRTIGINSASSLDGLNVSWLQEVRKTEYDFMMQVHEATANKLQKIKNK
jgi:hypothetical protein